MVKTLTSLALICLFTAACERAPSNAPESAAPPPGLSLSNAQVMQPLPGKSVTSGYFVLQNNLEEKMELIGASSPSVRSIEMHEIVRNGDSVRMRRLSSVNIDPGNALEFVKGGKHLMLFGASELPESLVITLNFADGSETAATFQQQRW